MSDEAAADAFNADPAKEPLRILLCTDAAPKVGVAWFSRYLVMRLLAFVGCWTGSSGRFSCWPSR
jgi:hypothetical protein